MPNHTTINLVVDPSLLDHVRGQLARKKYLVPAEAAITGLVSAILDSSPYPVRARQTGTAEIRISYHVRPFSQPILE